MVMTCGTTGGETEPNGRHSFHAILGIDRIIFFRDRSALAGGGEAARESRGDVLVKSPFRKQVAGNLLGGELIPWHIVLEGFDHPVAIRPDGAVVIDVDAVRVRIARRIEPMAGKMLGASGRLWVALSLASF